MTGALPEPKVSSEKTIAKNIAYVDKLIQIGSGAGLFTMIFTSIFMIDWGEPKDALTVAIVLFVPVLGLVRWLRREKV
jgi:hypothetical protein